jgi:outer membrane protein assembly factor BamB
MKQKELFCLVIAAVAFTAAGATPSWPAFRGPNSSGVAKAATPPVEISPTNSVLWKVQVPWSPSSPCVWENQLYLTTFSDNELQTRCYQCQDGKLVWSRGVKPEKLEMFHSSESSPAASTPATDGERVVSYFGSFGLVCYDRKGKELWRHALPVALSLGGYGTATSPLIIGKVVVVNHEQDQRSSLLGLDLGTGKKIWETPRPDSYGSYGTPIVWENNKAQEIVIPGSLRLKGYSLETGKEDWMVDGMTAFACTTPVVGDGLLYFAAWSDGKADDPLPPFEKFLEAHDKNKDGVVTLDEFDDASRDFFRGYDVNRDGKIDKSDWDQITASLAKGENVMVAVKPGGEGNISKTHVAWKVTRGLPYIASPLFYEGRIYLIKNGGMISSFDARTGEPFYLQERLEAPGYYYSSPVAANGRIYAASVSGKLTVIKAGGDKPQILHQAEFGERIFASPAVVGDKLFLRTRSTLYAFSGPGDQR